MDPEASNTSQMPTRVGEVFATPLSSPVISPPLSSTPHPPALPTSVLNDDGSVMRHIDTLYRADLISSAALDAQHSRNLMRNLLARGSDAEINVLFEIIAERERDEDNGSEEIQGEMITGDVGPELDPLATTATPMPQQTASHVSTGLSGLSVQHTSSDDIQEEATSSKKNGVMIISSSTESTSSFPAMASGSGSVSGPARGVGSWDSLEMEIIGSAIAAMTRMSRAHGVAEVDLPGLAITSSATLLLLDSNTGTRLEDGDSIGVVDNAIEDRYNTPPSNEKSADARNERRYRMSLVHDFHPSLTLPLWSPSPIAIGAVGYLSKLNGAFITLFNAFNPEQSGEPRLESIPNVYGFGKVNTGSQRQDKRNALLRGVDTIAALSTFGGRGKGGENGISQSIARRYSFPLRAGHKTAYLCTESTVYRYIESLDAPKRWFKANVDTILDVYGEKHHIQKEDLYFVIGTLDSPDYALFVSHKHPDGQAHFNVYTSTKAKQPWGTFTTDTGVQLEMGGPVYHEEVDAKILSASKVSSNGGPWNTVLVARLRFKPNELAPTSL
ncbi:hypothetical protein VNI00_013030 [Paramarasmius palmivorus]|uniref:Uncharacterized protein n=1 Tax=Paramarasmius palmivorus TaxID=297713 RepID=A0AAW0BZA9_9AGAR